MTLDNHPRHKLAGTTAFQSAIAPVPQNLSPGALDVRGGRQSFAVYLGSARITRYFSNETRAHEAASAIENRSRWKERPCITCGKTMTSTGPGHRMCNTCRAETARIA